MQENDDLFHLIRELLLEYAVNTFSPVDLSRICIYGMKWIDVQCTVIAAYENGPQHY